jgi:hypothetical protein
MPTLDPVLLGFLMATALVAGVVRGFSGFGAAMIFMPIAAALIGPVSAIVIMWAMDLPFSLPLAIRAVRKAQWREVLPLAVGACALLPIGVALVVHTDPVSVRWLICLMILVSVVGLASGWRYSGRPHAAVTVGIGGISGLFSGLSGIGGPPIMLFWLSGQSGAETVRANLMGFFGITSIVSGVIFVWRGLIDTQIVLWSLWLVSFYGVGIVFGTRLFGIASDQTFRRAAFALVIATAIIGLPWLDTWLR